MDSNIIVKEYLSVFQPNLYLPLRIVRVITVHKEFTILSSTEKPSKKIWI